MKQNWEESSEFLTESEFKDLQQIFSSSLELKKLKTWKNIDNDADILLHNLSKVNFQKLQQMGESMLSEGTQGTLELLRTLLKDEDNNNAYEKNDKIKQIKRLTKKAKTKVNERVQKLKEKVNAIKENFKTYILQEFESHILKQ
ncbi:8166_t:CDS:2 [Entrophospora sp. SA101]|nr:8166_t:CDS:2 [Entrophospora sp. SA101]